MKILNATFCDIKSLVCPFFGGKLPPHPILFYQVVIVGYEHTKKADRVRLEGIQRAF
jgi:hypothetical protein